MSRAVTSNDMKNLIKRRMVVSSAIFAVWLLGGLVLLAQDGFSGESFGASIVVGILSVWIATTVKNVRILKDESRMQAAAIARNDERNIMITYKATRLTMVITLCAAALSLIVLGFMHMNEAIGAIGGIICFTVVVYITCWYAVSKRS